MARIEGIPKRKAGPLLRFAYWMSKRKTGKVVEPLMIKAHRRLLMNADGFYELALERSNRVDLRLKKLASVKAASIVGCPF